MLCRALWEGVASQHFFFSLRFFYITGRLMGKCFNVSPEIYEIPSLVLFIILKSRLNISIYQKNYIYFMLLGFLFWKIQNLFHIFTYFELMNYILIPSIKKI